MNEHTTVIREADYVVAHDDGSDEPVFLRNADVAFRGNQLIYVGTRFQGEALEISGRGRMVMPGLINVHAHPGDEYLAKGVFDDTGSPALYGNALYEYGSLIETDREGVSACAQMTLADLALSGVTTVVDLSASWDGWLDLLVHSGLRCYAGPLFREARWVATDGRRLEYDWDHAAGRARFEAALALVDEALARDCDRLSAIVAPSQADTCSEALLREAHRAALEREVPFTLHAAQMMAEFDEMLARNGMSTVQWLDSIGILDTHTLLGHAIFLDHHSWTRLRSADDLPLLARREVSVAHCPVTFARSGMVMESLGAYRRAGVNVGLGTDSYPANMLEEMRQALLGARIAAKSVFDTDVGDVFRAATLCGAKALGRTDIGRLTAGAKADLVLVDLTHPSMSPVHDPLRSLVYCAAERAISHVWVDGEQIVDRGRLLTIDREGACAALMEAQASALSKVERLASVAPKSLRETASLPD